MRVTSAPDTGGHLLGTHHQGQRARPASMASQAAYTAAAPDAQAFSTRVAGHQRGVGLRDQRRAEDVRDESRR
jgi:hypothetical protein